MTPRTRVALELEERARSVVARITLDNPEKLNVLTAGALEAIVRHLRAAEAEARLRAVVLTGAGQRAFCGGVDIDALRGLDPASAREFIGLIHEACAALRACPVPVIARINGWCIGGALEIAAACDLRIAADNASFSMPEVRLGIPSVVEAALLPRLIGAGRARWLVMTGESIDAREAMAWGLIEKIASRKNLDEETDRTVESIISGGAEAMRAQKRLCQLWEEAPLATSVRESVEEFARSYESGEPRRRIDAFRRARKKR